MNITRETLVADIATAEPATIKVFQAHNLDFCCGGRIPLSEACERRGADTEAVMSELRAALDAPADTTDWQRAPLSELVGYIQKRFHHALREELPRLHQMVDRVVDRHGRRLPDTLLPLKHTFERLQGELLDHMAKEDAVLFPAIAALEASADESGSATRPWSWINGPIHVMEAEHEDAGAALARLREITNGYAPPEDACPTFRGLYYGLAQLESDMHLHVHLENNILFPRAEQLARGATAGSI
jgi:regulator of cell morphogenesis and NO signaling